MHMGIAAGEIGANIVEHAARLRPVRLWMDVHVLPSQVHGDDRRRRSGAYRLDAVSMPDDTAERGRGLAVALAVLGRLIYRRSDRNHWILESGTFV